jgi:DNA-binding GntR family transcriptional regulator
MAELKTASMRAGQPKALGRLGKPAPRSSLGGEIYRLLEDAIIRGELAAGQRLDEQGLADHFGVSRIPLREALSGLEAAGWIEKTGGRQGARVKGLSDDDLSRLAEVRGPLEGEAAFLAATRHEEHDIAAMRANVKKSRAAYAKSDRPKFVELNSEFHGLLAACSRNPVFEEILSMLDKRVRRVLWVIQPQVVEASIDEHEAIVDALERGDAKTAAEIARRHAGRHSLVEEPAEASSRAAKSGRTKKA